MSVARERGHVRDPFLYNLIYNWTTDTLVVTCRMMMIILKDLTFFNTF